MVDSDKVIEFSVGVCAYNEERNIGKLIKNFQNHKTNHKLIEIVIVSSGCNDRTEEIVRDFMKNDSRIRLIVEKYI